MQVKTPGRRYHHHGNRSLPLSQVAVGYLKKNYLRSFLLKIKMLLNLNVMIQICKILKQLPFT